MIRWSDISEDSEEIGNFFKLYRKYYRNLCPDNATHRQLFVKFTTKKRKCSVQCVGINKYGKMPAEIVAFL